ncbi:MAG: response regulator, partial [Planctomycetes bacterium]|nr:response regulator [Planctomycetota bacterium]
FDPFFTTKPKDQGTGLGLAIVYRIVQAHGGLIDVSSQPGRGTRVQVCLPEVETGRVDEVHAPAQVVHGTERILVVDDEQMIASLLKTLLEACGYGVSTAHSSNEALVLAQQSEQPIDLAIVDYELPGMAGDLCLGELRKKWPRLKAILITGYGMPPADLRAQCIRVVEKPFSTRAITQTVREVLDEPGP